MGRYSKAPRSVARTAVSRVDCALMTMMRRSGLSLRMRGTRSSPFSSGITTSVMTSWPSPSCTHCHSVAAAPVLRTLWPWRPSAWCRTVRMARSSSAIRMVEAHAHGAAWENCNGNITLKVVRPGSLSNSMAPPWSLMILATKARPRPVPVGLLVTKASNRWARISSADAAAVVAHRHDQRQVDLAPAGPGTASRKPCDRRWTTRSRARRRPAPRRRSSPGSGRPG